MTFLTLSLSAPTKHGKDPLFAIQIVSDVWTQCSSAQQTAGHMAPRYPQHMHIDRAEGETVGVSKEGARGRVCRCARTVPAESSVESGSGAASASHCSCAWEQRAETPPLRWGRQNAWMKADARWLAKLVSTRASRATAAEVIERRFRQIVRSTLRIPERFSPHHAGLQSGRGGPTHPRHANNGKQVNLAQGRRDQPRALELLWNLLVVALVVRDVRRAAAGCRGCEAPGQTGRRTRGWWRDRGGR
jgi:hypothetical protein